MTNTANQSIQHEAQMKKMHEVTSDTPSKAATCLPMPPQLTKDCSINSNSAFTPKFSKKKPATEATKAASRLIQAESTLVKQGSIESVFNHKQQ